MEDFQFALNIIPVGTIVPILYSADIPEGFIEADGREITIGDFPDLFSVMSDFFDAVEETPEDTEIRARLGSILPKKRIRSQVRIPDAVGLGLPDGLGPEFNVVESSNGPEPFVRWIIKAFRSPDTNIESYAEGKIS